MENSKRLALFYIKNGKQSVFPVQDIDHAVRLADAIADSDLMDSNTVYNIFDLRECKDGQVGDPWSSDSGDDFEEYWKEWLDKPFNKQGKWKLIRRMADGAEMECSVCGRYYTFNSFFRAEDCPYCHCGAKMDMK